MPIQPQSSLLNALRESGITPEAFANADRALVNQVRELAREKARRRSEALYMYAPLPWQEEWHSLTHRRAIMAKGNRVGGAQPLHEPVLTEDGWRPIGALEVGDRVYSSDGQLHPVTRVFPIKTRPTYRMTFDDGAWTDASGDHNWLCKMTKKERFPSNEYYDADLWRVRTTDDIIKHGGFEPKATKRAAIPLACVQYDDQPLPMDPYVLGVLIADGCLKYSTQFSTGDERVAELVAHSCPEGVEVRKLKSNPYMYSLAKRGGPRNAATDIIRELGLNVGGPDKFIPEEYLESGVDQRIALLQGLMDSDGECGKQNKASHYTTVSPRLARDVTTLVRSLGGKTRTRWRASYKSGKRVRDLAVITVMLPGVEHFRLPRKLERQKQRANERRECRLLRSITPLGQQATVCIEVDSPDHTYITRNHIVTHNSLCSFVELARALTGTDPYNKYPKEDGNAVVMGFGEPHIGRVIYKYLFAKGAFDQIRDAETGEWRVYRPWSENEVLNGWAGDLERQDEARPAPPLIPERYIAGFSWKAKGERIFSEVRFKNGWTLWAMNSAGDFGQAQGFDANLVVIDEDVATGGWLDELIGRTLKVRGLLRWNALPHSRTDDIINLIESGDDPEQPHVKKLQVTIYDNPFLSEESREEAVSAWKQQGEDVYRRRALGEVTLDSVLMYPSFHPELHNVMRDDEGAHEVQRLLVKNNGIPPEGWTRYLIFDPGFTIGAVAFFCVPPPELGDFRVQYDELYISSCTAARFGQYLEQKGAANVLWQDFIIDGHGGRLRDIGAGRLPQAQYEDEMQARGISCVARGSRFTCGSDDVEGRELSLRKWLEVRRDGFPTYMMVKARCPNTIMNMTKFRKLMARVAGREITTDKGNRRGHVHLAECFDSETDVLTREGWKRFADITPADPLATVSLEADTLEYQLPTQLINNPHNGAMLHFGGGPRQKLDLLVTPRHRMVETERGSNGEGAFVRKAGDGVVTSEYKLMAANWEGDDLDMFLLERVSLDRGRRVSLEKEMDPGDFAEFMGWYLSEGSADATVHVPGSGYRVCISQSHRYPRHRDLIRSLLADTPWNWIETNSGFQASSKQLWSYLRPFGHSHEKYVPDWIRHGSRRIIRRFMTSFWMGDGWLRSGGLHDAGTSSKRLADDLQEMYLKMGSSAGLSVKRAEDAVTRMVRGRPCRTTRDFYTLRQRSGRVGLVRRANGASIVREVDYSGRVYCATVPNGTLIVRRNGKPMVAGNCLEYASAHGLPYVQPPSNLAKSTFVDRILQRRKERRAKMGGGAGKSITLGPRGA